MTPDGKRLGDFHEFYQRTYPRAVASAYLLCLHWQDAEDAVQEAFTEALLRWDQIGQYESPQGWIKKIMYQRLCPTWRRRARLRPAGLDIPQPPAASAEHTALARRVLDGLTQLPQRQRQAIVLHCLDGWSQQEIADHMGISRGAVAKLIWKARRTLETMLGIVGHAEDALLPGARPVTMATRAPHRDALSEALHSTHTWLRLAAETDLQTMARNYSALVKQAERVGKPK